MNQELRIKVTIIHNSLFIIRKPQGFTLIELLWSVAIAAMLSAVGIAAFFTYSRFQTFNAAVSDFTTTLQVAKSNAQSQVKPATGLCLSSNNPPYPLDGYIVTIDQAANQYSLAAMCAGSSYAVKDQRGKENRLLPPGVTFTAVSPTSLFFPVITGGVLTGAAASGCVVISGFGNDRKISISGSGVINVTTVPNGSIC